MKLKHEDPNISPLPTLC